MEEATVLILLACYNGEKFICAQLDSILNQTYKNWKLIIRDDASADATPLIIEEYCSKFSDKIFILKDSSGNLGSVLNFNALIKYAKSLNEDAYIMFCDQDDVWLNNKIEITLNEMIRFEQKSNNSKPLLVYTNFSYVDEKLNEIRSKKNYSATKVADLGLRHLIIQNPVYGCTMMINLQLLKIIDHIPLVAENYDHWIALVASAFGEIIYLEKKTVLYRQHGKNISGQHSNDSLQKRFKRLLTKENIKDVDRKITMAASFRETFPQALNPHQKKIINDLINFSKTKSLRLCVQNINNGVRRQTVLQTILFYTSIFFLKPGVPDQQKSAS